MGFGVLVDSRNGNSMRLRLREEDREWTRVRVADMMGMEWDPEDSGPKLDPGLALWPLTTTLQCVSCYGT